MRSIASRFSNPLYSCIRRQWQQRYFCAANESLAIKFNEMGAANVLGGEQCCPLAFETFKVWHEVVSIGVTADKPDPKLLEAVTDKFAKHVDEKIVFSPPTYFKPWVGRDEFITIISCVGEVFGSSFKYGRQFLSPDGRDWALEFTAKIGDSGKTIQAMDVVKLDENGKIVDFYVIARPPNAVAELKKEMMARVPSRMIKMKAKKMTANLFG